MFTFLDQMFDIIIDQRPTFQDSAKPVKFVIRIAPKPEGFMKLEKQDIQRAFRKIPLYKIAAT